MTTDKLPETLYSPRSQILHPIKLLKSMWVDLTTSRGLAWRLMVRDISAQYRQTALGYFWAVFPPVVTTLIFILLNYARNLNTSSSVVAYPVYVMVGTVFWQLFVDAMNAPLKIATEAKAVITKINLPKEALILSGIGQVLFSFLIKLILIVAVLAFFKTPVKWTVLLVPLPFVALLLLGTMVGVLLMPLGLLFKDIQSALLIATSGLVFITPVGYTTEASGILGDIIRYNPLSPLIQGVRGLFFTGIPGDLLSFFVIFFSTLVLLFFGWVFYRVAIPIIVERIGM